MNDPSGFSMEKNFPRSSCLSPTAALRSASRFASLVCSHPNPSGFHSDLNCFTWPCLSFLRAFVKVRQGGAMWYQSGASSSSSSIRLVNSWSFPKSDPYISSCGDRTCAVPAHSSWIALVSPAYLANNSANTGRRSTPDLLLSSVASFLFFSRLRSATPSPPPLGGPGTAVSAESAQLLGPFLHCFAGWLPRHNWHTWVMLRGHTPLHSPLLNPKQICLPWRSVKNRPFWSLFVSLGPSVSVSSCQAATPMPFPSLSLLLQAAPSIFLSVPCSFVSLGC